MKYRVHLYLLITGLLLAAIQPEMADARLEEMSNDEMAGVCAASGVSFGFKDIEIFHVISTYRYCATDGGYIQFSPIMIHDGQGGPFRLNFDYPLLTDSGIMTFDAATVEVATEDDWEDLTSPSAIYKVMEIINVPKWDQEITYTFGNFTFSDGVDSYDLGTLEIGNNDLTSFHYLIAPHPGAGVDFEYAFNLHIDHAGLAYNSDCDNVQFKNLHFGSSFDYGMGGDDPADPSTWKTDIGEFKIGDMLGNLTPGNLDHSRPAKFDVGVTGCLEDGLLLAAPLLQLPMTGSIRFEQAEFAGTDFGPGAIDGINAYRLNLYFVP